MVNRVHKSIRNKQICHAVFLLFLWHGPPPWRLLIWTKKAKTQSRSCTEDSSTRRWRWKMFRRWDGRKTVRACAGVCNEGERGIRVNVENGCLWNDGNCCLRRVLADREPHCCSLPHLILNRLVCSCHNTACLGTGKLVRNAKKIKCVSTVMTTWS